MNAHDSKSCRGNTLVGSNPTLSAFLAPRTLQISNCPVDQEDAEVIAIESFATIFINNHSYLRSNAFEINAPSIIVLFNTIEFDVMRLNGYSHLIPYYINCEVTF